MNKPAKELETEIYFSYGTMDYVAFARIPLFMDTMFDPSQSDKDIELGWKVDGDELAIHIEFIEIDGTGQSVNIKNTRYFGDIEHAAQIEAARQVNQGDLDAVINNLD